MVKEENGAKELDDIFNAADTDGDKLLQEHEFVDYIDKCDTWMSNKTGGLSITIGTEGAKALYASLNTFTEGADGVSKKDIEAYMAVLREFFEY